MADLAVRRLFSNGAGRSQADVDIEDDESTARNDRLGQGPAWRSPRTLRLLSLTPFAVPIVETLFVRDYVLTLTTSPPDIIGAPLGLVLELGLLGLAALGAALVWRATSVRLAQLAVLLIGPIAIVGLVFRPAVIQMMRNLAV